MSADIQGVCQWGLFADRAARLLIGGLAPRVSDPLVAVPLIG